MEQPDLTCTLSGAELVTRVQEWARVASRATSRHVEEGRIVSMYPRDADLLQSIRELIALEADCCSFMHFTIEERPDEFEVELRVPDDMTEMLAQMLGALDTAASIK